MCPGVNAALVFILRKYNRHGTGIVAEETRGASEVLPRQRRVSSVIVGEDFVKSFRPRHASQHLGRW